jgi:hypothetical protein
MRSLSARRVLVRELPLVAVLSGIVYACSGTADVSTRRDGVSSGGSAADGSGGTANSSGTGTGGSGNAINLGGKGGGKAGSATGGSSTGGSSAKGGSSGTDDGGFGDAPSFGGFPDVTFDYEPEMGGQGGACASEVGQATLVKRPMDVIIAVDNSASMQGEIQAVQARINIDFANIINASGIDYRVILVSRYGNVFDNNYDGGAAGDSAFSVCIGSPLSSIACPADGNAATPPVANTPPRFYHHSTDISSHNMWCALMDSYETSDPISTHGRAGWVPVAPNGWKDFVRAAAYKVFIAITDDRPDPGECPGLTNNLAGATAFDSALRALDPAQFQTAAGARNYTWYSIVGMHADKANAVLTPTDPVNTNCCTAAGTADTSCQGTFGNAFADSAYPGEGYQELSIMTGGLRYPSCYNDNFDDIFNAIAQGVIEGAKASCVYDVPQPAHGLVDVNQTKVSYKPGSGAEVPLTRRASETACGTDAGFYYSDDEQKINLCPATCTVVQDDPLAKVALDFGCLGS